MHLSKLKLNLFILFTLLLGGCGKIISKLGSSSIHDPSQSQLRISNSENSTCMITAKGLLYCWGDNSYGKLGLGNPVQKSQSYEQIQRVDRTETYYAITMGHNFSCGILTSGFLKCMGQNNNYELGDQTNNPKYSPTLIDTSSKFKFVSTSYKTMCAITIDDQLKCWGNNLYGNVGNNSADLYIPTPTIIDLGIKFESVSVGSGLTCAITNHRDLKCWGINIGNGNSDPVYTPTHIDSGVKYIAVAVKENSACAITESYKLKCWGENAYGVIGDNSTVSKLTPIAIDASTNFIRVYHGGTSVCAITDSLQRKCWGNNTWGQLGDESIQNKLTPQLLDIADSFKQIAIDDYHACAIMQDESLKCWGNNAENALGISQTYQYNSAQPIDPTASFSSVSTGVNHSCAITTNGVLKCWGNNTYGALGDGTLIHKASPTIILSGTNFVEVAVGENHSCAITSAGQLRCWGQNSYGQVGHSSSSTANVLTPTIVDSSSTYTRIKTRANHTCGITSSGVLKCWGYNFFSQIGNNSTTNQMLPLVVDSGTSYSSIAVGEQHTCGVTSAGSLKCFGQNTNGQIGNNTTSTSVGSPTIIDQDVVYSAQNNYQLGAHTCLLLNNSQLKCWGNNGQGQLGISNIGQTYVPQLSLATTNFKYVSAANNSTCAIATDGSPYCMGENSFGQLGLGSTSNPVTTPAQPLSLSNIEVISLSARHGCAIDSNNKLFCWGKNEIGRIGNGENTIYLSPTTINF